MIRHLRVRNHKGIKDAKIGDLGMINVLAGRNNSGKSSVLEAIQNWSNQKCVLGEKVNKTHIEDCLLHFSGIIKNYSDPNPPRASKAFSESVSTLMYGELIFEDGLDKYIKEIYTSMSRIMGTRYNESIFRLPDCLNQIFRSARSMVAGENVCLIPAKRQLDKSGKMNFNEAKSFEASGKHILSHLFYLKNQPVSSEEYESFLEVLNAFSFVTEGLEFNIVPNEVASLQLFFSDPSGRWFPSADCGLGLQDILVIVSFLILSPAKLVMLEEPENHIHPDKQRRLLKFLSGQKNRQFILATHSGVFLDPSYIDRAIFVDRVEGEVKLEDRTKRTQLLKNLGYSIADNIGCDLVVLTEGPNDGPVLEVICKKMGFWEDFVIKFWPLGGDNMARFDFGLISESYDPRQVIALIDKDPKSYKARKRFQEKCEENGIDCFQLSKYAVENYVSVDAINNCTDLNKRLEISSISPKSSVENQIGFSIKKWLPILFSSMSLEDFSGSDLLEFCEKIRDRASRIK